MLKGVNKGKRGYDELHSRIVGSMFMTNGGITSVTELITSLITSSISCIIAVLIIARVFAKTSGEANPLSSFGIGVLYAMCYLDALP